MTPDQAKEILSLHSGRHEDIYHPKSEHGFIGMLRPYRGLIEENFHEVMEAIRVLAPELNREMVDTKLMEDLWVICYMPQVCVLYEEGTVRRHGLITPEDSKRLSEWIDQIAYAVMILLEINDPYEAFQGQEYKGKSDSS